MLNYARTTFGIYCNETLTKLQDQLKDLLHIPPYVLLPQDSCQRIQYTGKEESEVDQQVSELLLRLKRVSIAKCYISGNIM